MNTDAKNLSEILVNHFRKIVAVLLLSIYIIH